MDASKQAIRNDNKKEHGKDDLREGQKGQQGRYEGGRDADQPRQAEGHGRDEKDRTPQPTDQARGHESRREEDE